ncbi:MAG: FecR domain-containing protein [Lunatimonas sp.]|uniref:FecR family protein n=1 Tax=Lunatimonas sp. TaxID=2060141 RepID=UPI00263B7FDD|nr:FecR family protein [Lunatimonas sp.]MCC5938817.1 FecR domain-containing protein [Lunatimonas sp.]
MKKRQDHLAFLLASSEFVRWVKHPDRHLDDFWNQWLDLHPEAYPDMLKAKSILLGINLEHIPETSDRKIRILGAIIKENSSQLTGTRRSRRNTVFHWFAWEQLGQWSKVAAILTLVFLVAGLYRMGVAPEVGEELVAEAETVWIIKQTAPGEKLSFTLADGSTIWLNSATEFRFPERFDSSNRTVVLRGEAFFDVAPDSLRPFYVETGDLRTKVLGTSFNINLMHPDQHKISLISGKIAVVNKITEEEISLVPGQQLNYATKSGRTVLGKFNAEEVTGWKDGKLIFRQTSFWEVVRTLESWYGVRFKVVGLPKDGWRLTGEYHNQTLDMVLGRMAYIEDFTYSIHQKTINLTFKNDE